LGFVGDLRFCPALTGTSSSSEEYMGAGLETEPRVLAALFDCAEVPSEAAIAVAFSLLVLVFEVEADELAPVDGGGAFFFTGVFRLSESVEVCPFLAALAREAEEFSVSEELESLPDDEESDEDDDELLLDVDSELVVGCKTDAKKVDTHNGKSMKTRATRKMTRQHNLNEHDIHFKPFNESEGYNPYNTHQNVVPV